MAKPGSAGSVRRIILTSVLALGLIAAGFWAGRVTASPPSVPTAVSSTDVTVTVRNERIGQTINLNTTITQESRLVATNSLSGIVTKINSQASYSPGDIIFVVGGTPVRVINGSTPFWRDLAEDATGSDVRQLRDALVVLKLLDSSGDRFDAATARAVREWQRQLNQPATGRMTLGELIAVPQLPSRLSLDMKAMRIGARVQGGEPAVFSPTGAPVFELVVSGDQAERIPSDATVSLSVASHQWKAVISRSYEDDNGATRFVLGSPDGGPVCGDNCDAVSAEEPVRVLSQVTVVPPATGPAVPVAAVRTDASGTYVMVVNGASRERRSVKVKGAVNGLAIIDGVSEGEEVAVYDVAPADEQSNTQPSAGPEPSPSGPK